jgi:dipeptidyl aminopeptidase/acylaminoacyl peptidase
LRGPWTTRTQAEKRNPVNHVANWKTPALVIHGENHWILKAQNSIQWHRNVFGWLTQHLKSPGPMAAQ